MTTLHAAQLNARRSAELVRIDAVNQQDNENATAALNQAQADVAADEAALQGRKVILEYARIDAPISGQAGKSSVTQGALVTANQATALVTVQQLDPVNVDLTQSSTELLQLRRGWPPARCRARATCRSRSCSRTAPPTRKLASWRSPMSAWTPRPAVSRCA
jgi:multidrug efflux pump subunit AcrA (membrane-fusion protein)